MVEHVLKKPRLGKHTSTCYSPAHEWQCQYNLFMKFFNWFKRDSQDVKNAKSLLRAIDKGGIPTNPIKLNHIARRLGLEVSPSAPMAETIDRMRAFLKRK